MVSRWSNVPFLWRWRSSPRPTLDYRFSICWANSLTTVILKWRTPLFLLWASLVLVGCGKHINSCYGHSWCKLAVTHVLSIFLKFWLCHITVLGTNNARLATMLRQLAVYHAKDPNNLFCVRIAQGLTHLSKGTLTLCPYHSDRQIMNPVAVAGLLSFLVSCLDVKNSKSALNSSGVCHFCLSILTV